jgi:hypothetical protein
MPNTGFLGEKPATPGAVAQSIHHVLYVFIGMGWNRLSAAEATYCPIDDTYNDDADAG